MLRSFFLFTLTIQRGMCLILLSWVIPFHSRDCWSGVKLDKYKHLVPQAVSPKCCSDHTTESMRGGNLTINWTFMSCKCHLRSIIYRNKQVSGSAWSWELVPLLADIFWFGMWRKISKWNSKWQCAKYC